jgi:hypothetical protein
MDHVQASTVLGRPRFPFPIRKHAIFGRLPSRNPSTNQNEISTIDYAGEVTQCAKNGWNRLAGGGPTDRWNITSKTCLTYNLLYFFIRACLYTAETVKPICTHDGSNDVVCYKEVPFGVALIRNTFRGPNPPKTPHFGTGLLNFQPNHARHSNSFWTIRDMKIFIRPRAYIFKLEVLESKREAISTLGRHLAAKTTSGPILDEWKSPIVYVIGERYRRKTSTYNTNSKPMSGLGLSIGYTSDLLQSSP